MTLSELLAQLHEYETEHGGGTEVCIETADMKVFRLGSTETDVFEEDGPTTVVLVSDCTEL